MITLRTTKTKQRGVNHRHTESVNEPFIQNFKNSIPSDANNNIAAYISKFTKEHKPNLKLDRISSYTGFYHSGQRYIIPQELH